MASVIKDPGGKKRLQFVNGDGQRKTIRLGEISDKAAQVVRVHVEHLAAAAMTGEAPPRQTAIWLGEVGGRLHERLARAGLCAPRTLEECHTVASLLDAFFESLDVKESTRVRYRQTARLLTEHFGASTSLDGIKRREAEQFRSFLVNQDYAAAKVAKDTSIARQIFRKAHQWGFIAANPFDGIRAGSQHNRDRLHFVPPADAQRLLDATTDHDWRCIIALARWGGLRTPSETLRVRWVDVDWERGRLRVTSPKTEAHAGRGDRIIPLFPELRAVLMDAFEAADDGAVYVVGRYRDATGTNLRTHLLRLIDRAGLTAWPRLFNALRASRATELAAEYPIAVCTAWMGHTAAVAEAHYHMVREEDFDHAASTPTRSRGAESGAQAAQNPAQHRSAPEGTAPQARAETLGNAALVQSGAARCVGVQTGKMGPVGLEPTLEFPPSGF